MDESLVAVLELGVAGAAGELCVNPNASVAVLCGALKPRLEVTASAGLILIIALCRSTAKENLVFKSAGTKELEIISTGWPVVVIQ